MKIKEINSEIGKLVKQSDGYCPCAVFRTPDTRCPCREFRQSHEGTVCHCGRYEMEKKDE